MICQLFDQAEMTDQKSTFKILTTSVYIFILKHFEAFINNTVCSKGFKTLLATKCDIIIL